MKKLYFLFFTILTTSLTFGQTTLAPGDIVIIGLKADATKEFRFVPLVDLEMGTEIYFTDSGWISTTSSFRASEGAVKYTAPNAITKGTSIAFMGTAADIASNSGFSDANSAELGTNGINFSTSGDQILIFQGSGAAPTFIFAAQSTSTNWVTDATSSNNSAVPNGLTDGVNAVAYGAGPTDGAEFDNVWYTGTTSGTRAQILAAVANSANWAGNNSSYSATTGNFTLGSKYNQIEGFSIYPNPSSLGYVNITSRSNAEMNVSVFDVLGKLVINKEVSNKKIDVSNLKTGIYIMKVSQDDAVSTKKLVIQ